MVGSIYKEYILQPSLIKSLTSDNMYSEESLPATTPGNQNMSQVPLKLFLQEKA